MKTKITLSMRDFLSDLLVSGKGFSVFVLFLLTIFSSESVAQFPFVERQTWDGPYDIKMIAAPNLDPVYLDETQASSGNLLADSLITYNTMVMTGDLFEINNRYKGGSPFVTEEIPLTAVLCDDPMNGCGTLGLPTKDPNSSCPERYDSPERIEKTISMTYADYDNDPGTFSSSMADLDISACSEIEAAYLYWTGMFKDDNPDITLKDGPLNSYSGSGDVFNVSSSSGFDQVKLKIPGGNYQVVTAEETRTTDVQYLCVADVTNLVQGSGGGPFWVGDIQSYPIEGGGGSTSGWVLTVVFRSPLSPPRLISLFDGLESISSGDSEVFQLTGLQAPATNNFQSYVGFGALDGENIASQLDDDAPEGLGFQTDAGGAYYEINPFETDQPPYKLWTDKGLPADCDRDENIDDCKIPLFDADWCSVYDGISSSHITSYNEATNTNGNEIVRLPANQNTLGFDAHHLKLPDGAVSPGATEATLTVQAGPQGGTTPFFAYIAIERLQPKLEMTKTADKNSTELESEVVYNIRIKNVGNAPSLGGDIVYDTLDIATDFVPGSFSSTAYVGGVSSGAAGVNVVSTAGDNLEFELTNPIQPNDSIDISFSVQVIDYASNTNLWDVQCKRKITNTAWVDYNTLSSGILTSKSNANDCGIGSETSILIFDDQIGGSTTTKAAPIDACDLESDSIRTVIQAELVAAGIPASELSEFDIRDSAFVRVRPEDVFGEVEDTIKYFAIRDHSSGGNCQEIFEFAFVCKPCIVSEIISDSTDTICSGQALDYTILSDHSSATFNWSREAVTDISNAAITGQTTDEITESLVNTGAAPVNVKYVIVPSVNSCPGDTFHFEVTVNPNPQVTSSPTDTICSGLELEYEIEADIPGTTTSWSRALVSDISNSAVTAQVSDSITESLINTSVSPVVVGYEIVPILNGCKGDTFSYEVTVHPVPEVTSVAKDTVCSGVEFNYTIAADISSSNFSWTRNAVSGISNTTASDQTSNPISETLTNTGTAAASVDYIIVPTAYQCPGDSFTLEVLVNPVPEVNSAASKTICSGKELDYTITSNISSATFTWDRAAVTNISNPAVIDQNANPITETLVDTGSTAEVVRYEIVPEAEGCKGDTFDLDVTVNPAPMVTSPEKDTVCSGAALSYDITSNVTGATFTWERAAVSGISNAAASGQSADPITETLENTTSDPVVVKYTITPSSGTCPGVPFELEVTVNPKPEITSANTGTVCSVEELEYLIESDVTGASFEWARAAVVNIDNAAKTGETSNPIKETLTNSGTSAEVVNYSIVPTANSCTGDAFDLGVTVNPVPEVISATSETVCSGEELEYTITSNISSATFTWDRAAVTRISNAAVSGQTGNPIKETLLNTGNSSAVVKYEIVPEAIGCKGDTFDLDVTVNPVPEVTSAATKKVCSGEALDYQITSNIATSAFEWERAAVSGVSNPAVSGQTSDLINETLENTGTAPVTVTYSITPAANSCPGDQFDLKVTVNPVPEVTSASESTVCSEEALNYDITSNVSSATFTWSRSAVPNISNAAASSQSSDPITESLINTGSVQEIVKYEITPAANNCTGEVFEYEVKVNPATVISSHPQSATLCEKEPLSLSVVAAGASPLTYQWKLNGNNIFGETSSSFSISEVGLNQTGEYTVEVTGGCGSETSQTADVFVTALPDAGLPVSGSLVCVGEEAEVKINNSQQGVEYEAFIGSQSIGAPARGNGGDVVFDVQPSLLMPGDNIVSFQAYGCGNETLEETAVISVSEIPVANAGADTIVNDYGIIQLDGSASSQNGVGYEWTSSGFAGAITDPQSISPSVNIQERTSVFTLTVYDLQNPACEASDEVVVKLVPSPVKVPNAFSPNGDGIHDTFEIQNIEMFNSAILYVYNQWGELIYESEPGYDRPWNGKRNGVDVPVSAYYYVLEINEDGYESVAGDITVIR